jgi:hypothetical protein
MPVWQLLEELPRGIIFRRAQAPVQCDDCIARPEVANTGPSRCTAPQIAITPLQHPLQAAGSVDQPVLAVKDCDDAAIVVCAFSVRLSVRHSPASSRNDRR